MKKQYLIIYKTNFQTLETSIYKRYLTNDMPFKNFAEIDNFCKEKDNNINFFTWEII